MKKIFSLILISTFIFFPYGCGYENDNIINISGDYTVDYDWQLKYLDIDKLWEKTKGENVVVAVIDSGINLDLLGTNFDSSRILAAYNAYDCNDDMTDYTQHGTAMVSIIGANGEDGFYGIAPACNFVIIKALNEYGETNSEALVRAINFAVTNHADIINLALGGENASDSVACAILNAFENNIVITSAVGDQCRDNILFPAILSDTLSVAAIDCNGDLYIESNFSENVDVLAPGVDIRVPKYNIMHKKIETLKSGSSIATAFFSGALALYLSYYPKCDVKELYSIIRDNAPIDISNLFKEQEKFK